MSICIRSYHIFLVICYLPYITVVFFTTALGVALAIYLAREVGISLIFLNSSLNPLIFAGRSKKSGNL